MASKFIDCCASFAVGASIACFYVSYKAYKLELDNFQEERIRRDEVEALKQNLEALKQRLIVLENRKKVGTTQTGESLIK